MKIDNNYHIFRIRHKREHNDSQDEIYYVAEGAANGRQILMGGSEVIHDQPIRVSKDVGGLVCLAYDIFKLHTDYLSDSNILEKNEVPYLGFSFGIPYQITMWDQRVWFTERLSDEEQTEFLKEMQKRYISPPKS